MKTLRDLKVGDTAKVINIHGEGLPDGVTIELQEGGFIYKRYNIPGKGYFKYLLNKKEHNVFF